MLLTTREDVDYFLLHILYYSDYFTINVYISGV